jgi:DNA topoisomerase-1
MAREAVELIKITQADSPDSAREAGLTYISTDAPGIRRIKKGKEFSYLLPNDQPLTDKDDLARIKRLAIPPAWTDVWICLKSNGHLQATGYDARGRKQYRYHPRWREVRDQTKYNRMIDFALALPKIRKRIEHDFNLPGLPREKVLATIIKILETGLIRVGNDEYARANNSFGLTTMLDRHVDIRGRRIQFQFKGKSGKFHRVNLEDARLAKIVRKCQEIPGQELFQYIGDDGKPHDITSSDVNVYLKEITRSDFTAKDFRTWSGTVLAAVELAVFNHFQTKKEAKKNLLRAIEAVSLKLGNTPAICRKCYIHPFILDAYMDGKLTNIFNVVKKQAHNPLRQVASAKSKSLQPTNLFALKQEETAVLNFLQKQLSIEKKNARSTLIEKLEASIHHRRSKQSLRGRGKTGKTRVT